jgi:hypothetical protein
MADTVRRPALDALLTAAEWLDAYDGGVEDDGRQDENEAECHATAAWLRHLVWESRVDAATRKMIREWERENDRTMTREQRARARQLVIEAVG